MLIGVCGAKRHGKGEIANYLVESYGFQHVKFADRLKDMLRAGFGLKEAEIEGDLKEQPCHALCGETPRRAMQTLGTEWGRKIIHPDVWTNITRLDIQDHLDHHEDVVVDDVRFPNELSVIQKLGGRIVRVVRPSVPVDLSHESEFLMHQMFTNGEVRPYYQVENSQDIPNLRLQVDVLVQQFKYWENL